MQVPGKFHTSQEPVWLNADWANLLGYSLTAIANYIKYGYLTPQWYTAGSKRAVYTMEYVEWAKANVPIIKKRLAELKEEQGMSDPS